MPPRSPEVVTRLPVAEAPARLSKARVAWFALLLGAVCFEGLGRKLFPSIPGPAFYFAKDALLLAGLAAFGLHVTTVRTARRLLRGFMPFLPLAILWTVAQLFNPELERVEFGILGLRGYWLWWLAPLVVASALRGERERAAAMGALALCAVAVASVAIVQFSMPPSHPLNRYASSALTDATVATVASTGRTRVTSTFAYITGFSDFVTIVPALLLAAALSSRSAFLRWLSFGAAALCAAALPMSGSRAPVLLGIGALAVVAYATGSVFTRMGRRMFVAGGVCVAGALLFSPDAAQGVRDRFLDDGAETHGRLRDGAQLVPPLAMLLVDHPALGLGTGTLQNAAIAAGEVPRFLVEAEQGRVLIEQGIPGYLLLSILRVGLIVALLRAGRRLKRAGRRPEAGVAWALAALTLPGHIFFNHVFQALYFIAAGIVLEALARADPVPAPSRSAS
jgi:hypothetical protein